MHALYPLVAVLMLCGCNRSPQAQSGDFAAYLVEKVSNYGGHKRTTNAVPPFEAKWQATLNADGFRIHVVGAQSEEVTELLRQLYGSPRHAFTNAQNQVRGMYGFGDIGILLNFSVEGDGVSISTFRGTFAPPPAKR